MPRSPHAGMETETFGSLAHTHSPSHPVSWGLDADGSLESVEQLHQLSMPTWIEWPQHMSTTTLATVDPTSVAAQQYVPRSVDWRLPPTPGDGSFGSAAWSPSRSLPWDPGALSTLPVSDVVCYPLTPLEPDPATVLFSNWQHDQLAQQREYGLRLSSGYDFGAESGETVRPLAGPDDRAPKRKRERSPAQGQDADAAYLPRRSSASDASYTASTTPDSATALAFHTTDSYHLGGGSDTTTIFSDARHTTSPRDSATALTFHTPDSYHLSGGSDTTTTPQSPTTTSPPPNPNKRAHLTRHTTTTPTPPPTTTTTSSTSSTTTTTPPPTPKKKSKKPTAQARNRAAASRYRAKTQAASAQLEAAEREASERRESLLACAAQLRDEVFRLKNELLRHADCGCPLIRGYLAHAAERACWGLRGEEHQRRPSLV